MQKLLGNDANISWGLATLEGSFDSVESRVNDLVGQLKVVEPLPELGELFVPSPLQLLFCSLVMPATCVANAAGLPLSDLKVFGVIQLPTAHRLTDDLDDYLSECLIHLASINSFSLLPHGNTITRSSF